MGIFYSFALFKRENDALEETEFMCLNKMKPSDDISNVLYKVVVTDDTPTQKLNININDNESVDSYVSENSYTGKLDDLKEKIKQIELLLKETKEIVTSLC